MVLSALDNNLTRSSANSTDNDDITTEKRSHDFDVNEKEQKVTELSIIVSSDEDDEPRSKPPRPAAAPSMRSKKPQVSSQQASAAARRRRRRSSARFLNLTGRFEDQEEEEENQQEHLGEMYKRAIRMNAENRINAGNSWGLRLIENIDKFLVDDAQDDAQQDAEQGRVKLAIAMKTDWQHGRGRE